MGAKFQWGRTVPSSWGCTSNSRNRIPESLGGIHESHRHHSFIAGNYSPVHGSEWQKPGVLLLLLFLFSLVHLPTFFVFLLYSLYILVPIKEQRVSELHHWRSSVPMGCYKQRRQGPWVHRLLLCEQSQYHESVTKYYSTLTT